MEPLTPAEARVLGCLVEKEAAVPDTYPLTRNALRQACNQTSSRDPVVAFDDLTVQRALDSLKARGLVRFVHPVQGERATKFRHVADELLDLDAPELAVLSALVLRGAQTPGELRSRTERLHGFSSPEDVEATLSALADRDDPLVVELPRQPGQHGQRWAHLLSGPIDVESLATFASPRPHIGATHPAAHDRVAALEVEVASLRARLARLEQELGLSSEG
ncbi:MAG: YceH family protein [Actinomycetota bacterium]|nr:YceH family protein [Acidimicrobiia bacterium]MDQ3292939.1 YceH family protein [Actinomycetota bacterium]